MALCALKYAQAFGNRVKESLKELQNRSGLHSRKVELSHVKYYAFVSTLNMSLPSMQTMTKEDEVGMGADWIENFLPV